MIRLKGTAGKPESMPQNNSYVTDNLKTLTIFRKLDLSKLEASPPGLSASRPSLLHRMEQRSPAMSLFQGSQSCLVPCPVHISQLCISEATGAYFSVCISAWPVYSYLRLPLISDQRSRPP